MNSRICPTLIALTIASFLAPSPVLAAKKRQERKLIERAEEYWGEPEDKTPAKTESPGKVAGKGAAKAPANTPATANKPDPFEDANVEEIQAEDIKPFTDRQTWYSDGFAQIDRTFNAYTARTARAGSFIFTILHRASTAIQDDPFQNYLGFDGGGLKVGLELRYGIVDDAGFIKGLDVGIFRLNNTLETFDTYQFDARLRFLSQKTHGIDTALRGGVTWFAQPDKGDAAALFGQLLISRIFDDRTMVNIGVAYHGDSSNPQKSDTDTSWSAGLQAGVEVRLLERLAMAAEGTFTIAGYRAKSFAGNSWPTFTIGPKIITNRHTFSVVLSNTQYITADGVITNTPRGLRNTIFGFNITRELGS
ncbi:MAG: DUF5777 family beta-barrel protein [Myxococcota bacterium]